MPWLGIDRSEMRASGRRFRVGAAVGSGMAARAAENAGADFILALGAGKLRSMGVPSPASLLPIYDSVEFTLQFASQELVPRVKLPVYVGLPLFDPRLKVDELMPRLKSLKIVGLTNFPAVFHFGDRAAVLDAHGLGFKREIDFLTAAMSEGFDTIGYVRSRDEASKMVEAGLTSLCINFGLNPHNHDEMVKEETLDHLALAAKDIVDSVRRPHKPLTVYLGGGPVSGGADLERLCRKAGIDGFIGGSAMDRAPLEKSLLNSVASFREIEVLQDRVERLERRLNRYSKRYGIVCRSDAMDQMLNRVESAVRNGMHLFLHGEADTGRRTVAEMAARQMFQKKRGNHWKLEFSASSSGAEELFGAQRDASLRRKVGVLELAGGADVITIVGLESLPLDDRSRIVQAFAKGEYQVGQEARIRQCNARFILVLDESGVGGGTLPSELDDICKARAVQIPPLRDRIEDIPLLVKGFTAEFKEESGEFSPSIIRTLIRHNWPGNLAELRKTVGWLIEGKKEQCSEDDLISYLRDSVAEAGPASISQRDRIIQALLLNNLNRTKTADHLGVTRKTLYNQIKKFKILT